MKILYAGQSLLKPIGGGEISAYTLLKELAKKHEVLSLGINEKKKYLFKDNSGINFYEYLAPIFFKKKLFPYHLTFLLIEQYFQEKISKAITEYQPDLVIFQNPAYLAKVSRKFRTLIFIRSMDWYGIEGKNIYSLKKLFYSTPFFKIRHRKNKKFLKNADLVIANSFFIKKKLSELMRVNSEVVYPFIELDTYRINDIKRKEQEYITFVNLRRPKGGEIALEIAAKMPKKTFLFIKGAKPEEDLVKMAEGLKNVKLVSWAKDMKEIYRKTKILLVPSLEESFGRLAIEAGINGIPTVASECGDLPTVIGDSGIVVEDTWNINKWTKSIRSLDNEWEYSKYSILAKENAQKFDFKNTLKDLKRILNNRLRISL